VVGPDRLDTPDKASVHVKLAVTGPLFQPNEFGLGLLEPMMLGGVRSMLIPLTVVEAVFPALSVQVPVADCPDPELPSIVGLVTDAMPDRESEQVKVTVTGLLFQPLPFGPGLAEPAIVGCVLSIFIVTVTELETPTPFVAVQVTVVPEV